MKDEGWRVAAGVLGFSKTPYWVLFTGYWVLGTRYCYRSHGVTFSLYDAFFPGNSIQLSIRHAMPRLILASQSAFRRQLLEGAGYIVETVVPIVAEPDAASFADLDAGLIHIAALKARSAWHSGARA